MNPFSNIDEFAKLLHLRDYQLDYLPILLLNPNNLSEAGKLILDNYKYLNTRTGGINFYIPGISPEKLRNGISSIHNTYKRFSISSNPDGFNEFIKILESLLPGFIYGEGTELIVIDCEAVKSYIGNPFSMVGNLFGAMPLKNIHLPEECFAQIDLDKAIMNGENAVRVLTFLSNTLRESKSSISDIKNYFTSIGDISTEVKIFIAGSTLLKAQRNAVSAELLRIQNKIRAILRVFSSDDFDDVFIKDGAQRLYLEFIKNDADYVIFILDDEVGGITMKEFQVAMSSFEETGHPKIFAYNKVYTEKVRPNNDIEFIKSCCSEKGQYYTNYYGEALSDRVYRSFYDRLRMI